MEQLLQLVDQERIALSYFDLSLSPRRLYGLYFVAREVPHIILHKDLEHNLALHRSILAEELGHHFTVPQSNVIVPYTSYSMKLALSRDESRALRWACDFLMPDVDFRKAIHSGITNPHDFAEYFVVTPWLVYRKLRFFIRRRRTDADERR
jgi:Zn-dependent peptidase ImmA (M78 family)